jgi:DTW domain-containing protein
MAVSGGNMDSIYKVKQITSLCESCNMCGLPVINCICDKVERVKTKSKIWILSSEREFYRPSNTARLLKLINPGSTDIYLWERTNEPKEIINNINDENYETFLLFPDENENILIEKDDIKHTGKPQAFIIIDGTWKEAKKILNKSDYLKKLPRISLQADYRTKFDLRKGSSDGSLCTIEAAIESLNLVCEKENARIIEEGFNLFLKSYKASISGHRVRE